MAEIGKDLEKAMNLLVRGDVVAIPTETVYGLAGNALNIAAITKVFEIKDRPHFDPLIVHVPDLGVAKEYVQEIPEQVKILTEKFWPGPLTILLKKKSVIPDLVTSGLDTVGIRCPDHALTRDLLQKLSFPLAAPSANPFGYVSPVTPHHVNEQLGNRISYILDGGTCDVGIESTIIGFEDRTPIIYRLGGLSVEKIEEVIGPVSVQNHSSSNPKAPGQLKNHYAPRKKVVVGTIETLLQQHGTARTGILTFQKNFNHPHQFILSYSGNLAEAAKNLFIALREFDKMPIDIVLAELAPEHGLGRAINDRLRRASAS